MFINSSYTGGIVWSFISLEGAGGICLCNNMQMDDETDDDDMDDDDMNDDDTDDDDEMNDDNYIGCISGYGCSLYILQALLLVDHLISKL